MEEESNGKQVFLGLCILTNTYITAITIKQLQGQCISYLFNRAYSIITNKDYLYIENLEWNKC